MINMWLEELHVNSIDIFEFDNAADAYENFYDLIICNLHMPEMNRDELVEKTYHFISHLEASRIIMVSGEEDPSYKTTLKSLNAHQFIKKPINPSSLYIMSNLIFKENQKGKDF